MNSRKKKKSPAGLVQAGPVKDVDARAQIGPVVVRHSEPVRRTPITEQPQRRQLGDQAVVRMDMLVVATEAEVRPDDRAAG